MVICKSGLSGWRNHIQENYSCFEHFEACCDAYGIHTRLGYKTIKGCWRANPLCEGSVLPEDFRKCCAPIPVTQEELKHV